MAELNSMMGMSSWFFGRIDYQDRAKREATRTCEVVQWPSKSSQRRTGIMSGVTRHYGPPDGFNYDWSAEDQYNNAIVDSGDEEDQYIKPVVDKFVADVLDQAKAYSHPDEGEAHIMFTFGEDFNYKDANTWYRNVDALIREVNKDGRVKAFYSTPSQYAKAMFDAQLKWPTKEADDDWFPYGDGGGATYDVEHDQILDNGDNAHALWTGYFTSRAAWKTLVRRGSTAMQSCRTAQMLLSCPHQRGVARSALKAEALEMGVAQHHDGVSGIGCRYF